MFRKRVRLTGASTHHFFVLDATLTRPLVVDPDGAILVFTDRGKAEQEGHERVGRDVTIAVVGMGDEKWAEFRRTQRHRVVE